MTTKTKTFDCVAMKQQAQRELMEEYESRRGEFSSYAEFLRITSRENEEVRQWRESLHSSK